MKVLKISKLTPLGLKTFESHIEEWPNNKLPDEFLINPIYSKSISEELELDSNKLFEDRLDIATYLEDVLGKKFIRKNYDNSGLWDWISALYFSQLHPKSKVSKSHNYIFDTSLHYRHCIAMPIKLLVEFGYEFSRIVLGSKTEEMGDGIEQIASKQYILRSDTLRSLVLDLYKDPKTGLIKTGATGDYEKKLKKLKSGKVSTRGQGGARRLGLEIKRLSLTYKLDEMPIDKIKGILSSEYKKYYNVC